MCLGRCLLRKPRLLVLDEATSSLDMETDSRIQGCLRCLFKECTVVAIAHRLETILDCDKVMCVHEGTVTDIDTPHNLIHEKPDSILANLHRESGKNGANDVE